jgi:hypothetical protein
MTKRFRILGGQAQPDPSGDLVWFADFREQEAAAIEAVAAASDLFTKVADGEVSAADALAVLRWRVQFARSNANRTELG